MMAKRAYSFDRGGPKQLRLRWGWGMKNLEAAVGTATWKLDRAALDAGATLVLPDGSSLLIQRPARPWWSMDSRNQLSVERDGVPVPGSDGDPPRIGRRVASLIVLFGLLHVAIAAAQLLFQPRVPAVGEALPLVGLAGLVLIVLGVLAAFGRRMPVAIAAGLLGLETLAVLGSGGIPSPIGLAIQVLVIAHLVRSWRRMEPRAKRPSLASVFE
jgi:hypothetical protein